MPLLDFETEEQHGDDDEKSAHSSSTTATTTTAAEWKDRGDRLLRIGDASAATTYYEMALRKCSTCLHIGSSVLINVGGHAVLAEVDCIDRDDIEVTIPQDGTERTVKQEQIILCVSEPDTERMQERILLNLTRCLLQLAESSLRPSARRPAYLRAAVLGATLAFAVASLHDAVEEEPQSSSSATGSTALLLRSQAFAAQSKFSHSLADAKKLLRRDPEHKEGRKWLMTLERQRKQQKKTDKRLAKEVSRWVQSAMNESVSSEQRERNDGTAAPVNRPDSRRMLSSTSTPSHSKTPRQNVIPWLSIIAAVLFAWILQKQFEK
jgi:preprotein translocase subunit YajC